MNLTVGDISQAYPDLTPEEQQVLLNIRQRKEELLQEIYQLKEELSDVNTEIGKNKDCFSCTFLD